MIFSSVLFLFRFLPIFLILYYATYLWPTTGRAHGRVLVLRNVILVLGSLVFYAWGEPVYVVLLAVSTLVNYVHGLLIERCREKRMKKVFLISSILFGLLILGFFKYADFLVGVVNQVGEWEIRLPELSFPIGLSFYTFRAISYTVDIYRGESRAERNLLDFGVFMAMFPQLAAGPIVRYGEISGRLREHNPTIEEVSRGLRRFISGLAKKVLLANNLVPLWQETVCLLDADLTVLQAWLGIAAFALQLYFDFSGYCDMAIGLGGMLGFYLPENFRHPYTAGSVTEFWRRFHTSLGRWFRDYVYIPLGGSRKGKYVTVRNIVIVWLLIGIWHGPDLSFLLWGAWSALFLILEKVWLHRVLKRLPGFCGVLYTVLVMSVGWVFFALDNVGQAWMYLKGMFGANGAGLWDGYALYLLREYGLLLAICIVGVTPFVKRSKECIKHIEDGPAIALKRWMEAVIPALLLLLSIAYVVSSPYNPFLYFSF